MNSASRSGSSKLDDSRPRARTSALTPSRSPSTISSCSDGTRAPASIREMYAAVQPSNASSRWLSPAPSRAFRSRRPTSAGLSMCESLGFRGMSRTL